MGEDAKPTSWNLGSDIPLSYPSDDAYGYAPFASQIAQAIVNNVKPHGLVLAIDGKWGSGKSSMLNFIKHDLKILPEEERPVLVDFNPWWFEGREQIATQLLGQFSAQLPDRMKQVRVLAKVVGQYSTLIASLAADYSGHPGIKALGSILGRIPGLKSTTEKAGVPQIKKKVATALRASGKRFVFFVDDIDRLTPDEARDFFRAIKALADFPEVVYVLFFDREEVAKALTASLKMDGEAYLEKIVQAPFHLPAVDKSRLQQKLFSGLDAIIESRPMPFPFDQGRWIEVFSEGLDHYVRKPRDIVRILNAISIVYPPLAGEVNPVDFIALEFLRVFEPTVYGSLRDGKEFFCGRPGEQRKAAEKAYFEKWRESLPGGSRERIVSLVGRLFPKVAHTLGGASYFMGNEVDWRKELRPCASECVNVYFQFAIPEGHITWAELERLVSADTRAEMAALLLEAREYIFPDGHCKAGDLIDRLWDFDELDDQQAAKLAGALIDTSHALLRPADERGGLLTALPNRWRILGLAARLMNRLDPNARQRLLMDLVASSSNLLGLVGMAGMALESKRDPSKAAEAMVGLDDEFPASFAAAVGKRLDQASLEQLLSMPELDYIVSQWNTWGNPERIREVFKPMVDDDEQLLILLDKFVRVGLMHSGSRTTETYQLAMRPLEVVMDVVAVEPRIRALQARHDLTARQRAATARYLKGMERIRDGKNPDGFYSDDFDH